MRMSWKVILAVSAILAAAVPAATQAESTRPASPFRQYTCDQKHDICIQNNCIRTGLMGDALKRCQETCAGKWLKCKGIAARGNAEVGTVQPEPTRK